MNRKRKRTERVAIIGGGIAGALAARELAFEGYDVSIFEEDDNILSGTSAGALQGHLGGMYSGNVDTALECLQSTIGYAKEFPFAIHKGRDAHFLVSEKSDMSMDEFLSFYDKLKEEYANYPPEDQTNKDEPCFMIFYGQICFLA